MFVRKVGRKVERKVGRKESSGVVVELVSPPPLIEEARHGSGVEMSLRDGERVDAVRLFDATLVREAEVLEVEEERVGEALQHELVAEERGITSRWAGFAVSNSSSPTS